MPVKPIKVAFGNEVAEIAQKFDFDPVRLMQIFVKDTKLNISPYYLIPGLPYGGYCLPKDVLGLRTLLQKNGVNSKLIPAIYDSNEQYYQFIYQRLEQLLSMVKEVPNMGLVILLPLS